MPDASNPPIPPRTPSSSMPEDQDTEADSVADQIEAGYDIQSDAATKSLVDDPASSSESEDLMTP